MSTGGRFAGATGRSTAKRERAVDRAGGARRLLERFGLDRPFLFARLDVAAKCLRRRSRQPQPVYAPNGCRRDGGIPRQPSAESAAGDYGSRGQAQSAGDLGAASHNQKRHGRFFREGGKTGRNSKTRCSGSLAGHYGNRIALRGDARRERRRRASPCLRGAHDAQDRRSEG